MFNDKRIPVLIGRNMLQFDNTHLQVDGTTPFLLRVLDPKKPLTRHLVHAAHNQMGCTLSKHTYRDQILREGFYWPTMLKACQEFRDECSSCIIQNAAMRTQSKVVQAPGSDFTVLETLQEDPQSVVIIDETGWIKFKNGKGGYGLMVVELMSGRVILLAIPSTGTADLVDALERLQSIRGAAATIILDPASSHDRIANMSALTREGKFIREMLNDPKIKQKLGDMGIQVKVAGAAAHHQAGRAENVSKNMKIFQFNVCHGMEIKDGLHLQAVFDKMAGVFNNRIRFIDHEGQIHTSNTFLEAAARVSRIEPQDITKLVNTDTEYIIYDVQKVAAETRRIATVFASHYMHRLLGWQIKKFGKQPLIRVNDVVIITDRILLHHYRSARRAIGRVQAVSTSGQTFRIKVVSKGKGDVRPDTVKHRKHLILLARCDDSQGKLTHIDPLEDAQVSEMMRMDRMSLESAFFSSGLEKLPCIVDTNKAVSEFEDPADLAIEADLSNLPTAADLFHKRTIIKDVPVKHDKKDEAQKDLSTSDDSAPEEYAAPPVVTRTGRTSRPPARFK